MWPGDGTFIFRVELDPDKPWMTFKFNDFDQVVFLIRPDRPHTRFGESFDVFVVEFKTMPVAFADIFLLVNRVNLRIGYQFTGI